MLGCYTLVSEPDPEPTSSYQSTKKFVPCHNPHHKNGNNGNHGFKYLKKRHEIELWTSVDYQDIFWLD
jgi:hypothetical protein